MSSQKLIFLSLVAACLVLVVSAQQKPKFNFNAPPAPPRTRFEPNIQISGNNKKNFGGYVGGRLEHDIVRRPKGATVTGYVQGGQGFARVDGHTYKGKPSGEAGVRVKIPF